mmetsp:Transcript_17561/g.61390  ORF Transcript_17561/g.61390 Transcript_17561/m.61390 type:complete len:232 (-) Transcript_17561:1510-2205(-)
MAPLWLAKASWISAWTCDDSLSFRGSRSFTTATRSCSCCLVSSSAGAKSSTLFSVWFASRCTSTTSCSAEVGHPPSSGAAATAPDSAAAAEVGSYVRSTKTRAKGEIGPPSWALRSSASSSERRHRSANSGVPSLEAAAAPPRDEARGSLRKRCTARASSWTRRHVVCTAGWIWSTCFSLSSKQCCRCESSWRARSCTATLSQTCSSLVSRADCEAREGPVVRALSSAADP